MIEEYSLRLPPEIAFDDGRLSRYIAREKGKDERTFTSVRVLRRSIDARQRNVFVNLKVRVYINEEPDDCFIRTEYPDVEHAPEVLVVGAGPAGLFAALRLIEKGCRPIVVERGKNVHERKKDIAGISRNRVVNPESNYCFGEGGAGAFSDGKLYTRSKKRGSVDKILNVFCQHGASTNILCDAHPHIGTDKLPRVVENIRHTIEACGGKVMFDTRMDRLIVEGDRVLGLRTAGGMELRGPVILATGHSARDVYRELYDSGIEIESKGLAVGVRLEHPAHLIDEIMYHRRDGRGAYLPAAEYRLVRQVSGRGVYSFCMCPGGFVVPTSSVAGQTVVNGMSPSDRGSRWSNSGMVVELHPDDLAEPSLREFLERAGEDCDARHPLCMMLLQEVLEGESYRQGGAPLRAPAQRMADFVARRSSDGLPTCSYLPGTSASELHAWIPAFVTTRLTEGFRQFGRALPGFLTNEALLLAVESRTSAPVRIVRSQHTLQHVRLQGLFPCGEGAGYAGGIVSAAIDGERCADAAALLMGKG